VTRGVDVAEGDTQAVLLADDFYFTGHDHISGKRHLSEGATGLGLAASLLGELVMFDRITVDRANIRVVNRVPPEDALAFTILEHLLAEPTVTTTKEWLLYLRQDAEDQVGQRLLRAGHVRRVQARKLLRTTMHYVPVDLNTFLWPATRLEMALRRREQVDLQDLFLAGLINVTDLHRSVIHGVPSSTTSLSQLLPALPPALRELLVITDAVYGDAVLTHRL
jgi:hypothetical protein